MDKLDFTVERIDESSNAIITNLFEYYLHDMAEWFLFDTGDDGTLSVRHVETLADAATRSISLRCAGKLAGFTTRYVGQTVAERRRRLRRRGVLRHSSLSAHRCRRRTRESDLGHASGTVAGARLRRQLPAIPFWRKIISRYTNDRQIEERRIVNGKAWSFFHFKSGANDTNGSRDAQRKCSQSRAVRLHRQHFPQPHRRVRIARCAVREPVSRIVVESAGTEDFPHVVKPMVSDYLRSRGLDVYAHRRRTLTPADARCTDLVVAMSTEHVDDTARGVRFRRTVVHRLRAVSTTSRCPMSTKPWRTTHRTRAQSKRMCAPHRPDHRTDAAARRQT